MEIKIDNVVVKELSDFEVQVITDMVFSGVPDMTINDILVNTADNLYAERIKYLKDAWLPALKREGITSIPVDDVELVKKIFASDSYKNAKLARDNK